MSKGLGSTRLLVVVVLVLAAATPRCLSFTAIPRFGRTCTSTAFGQGLYAAKGSTTSSVKSVVVISPPGGVGEVTAVKAATMGSSVRWFVVSPTENQQVILSKEALEQIASAGGSVSLAGADVTSLLLPADDAKSSISAVSTWCGAADTLVCTFDGVEAAKRPKLDEEDPQMLWKNAIKVAAKEASTKISGTKIAILAADEDALTSDESEGGGGAEKKTGGFGDLVGGILGGNKISVPSSLAQAMAADAASVILLRHGKLFGTPESSPEFSALVGGPRKDPILCEEYVMRDVRVDPTLSVSGNVMAGSSTRSSRHAVGEAAALLVLDKIPTKPGLDVCVSSLRGTLPVDLEQWLQEFQRVDKMMASGTEAQLFAAEFESVPDKERLANWLATKWAPAVLRTYDIAAIRKGERPVYALRTGPGKLEVVWQQLVDFDSVTAGRMVIEVMDNGLVATRGPGDASKGFGKISRKPLQGEDVLVRLLAEGAAQAVEKGLATKPKPKPKLEKKPEPVVQVVSSVQSFGSVEVPQPDASESGPRAAGARRSTERARGTKRRGTESTAPGSSSSEE